MKYSRNFSFYSCCPKSSHVFFLIIIGIIVTLPSFVTGNVIGHDVLSHLLMSRQFIEQLSNGEFYPRWLADLNNGLGSPVMFFYGPVSYYMTGLFHPLVGSDPEGWHQLGLATSLAVIASGFSSYFWLRQLVNSNVALVSSALYMMSPYHLVVDLYQRFAFAELWGFVWLPFILWWTHAEVCGRRGAWLGVSLGYALLIMTHMPTALLFSPVPVLYGIALGGMGGKLRAAGKIVCGMVLGIGLSALFLAPALSLLSGIQFHSMESGSFYFANNFLFYGPRATKWASEELMRLSILMLIVMMVMICAYVLKRRLNVRPTDRAANFWLGIGCAAFFMMLPLSKPVWDIFPFLHNVQFPSRFGSILTIAMTALFGLWLDEEGRKGGRYNGVTITVLCLFGILQMFPIVKIYRSYDFWFEKPSLEWLFQQVRLYDGNDGNDGDVVKAAEIGGYLYFIPEQADPGFVRGVKKSYQTLRAFSAQPDVVVLNSNSNILSTKFSHLDSRHFEIKVNSKAPVSLLLKQFYFTGWVATLRGNGTRLQTSASHPSGLIMIENIPPGSQTIDVILEAGPAERAGQVISFLSFMIFLATGAWLRYLAKRGSHVSLGATKSIQVADQNARLEQD